MLDTLNALLWRAGLGLTVIALAAATASSASAAAPAHGVWVANGAANTLTEFSFTAGAGSSPIATIASNSGSLHTPSGIALDGHGDLWVANAGNDTIVEYTPDQLAHDGSPVPALTLGSGGGLFRPTGLAFDAASNLWATNVGDSTIVEYTAQQLGEGSNAAPAVTIAADSNHTLDAPVFPAFDVQGDLWVPNLADNTVVEYTPSQLAASGAPAPATTISSTTGAGALDLPWAVRFDAKGDLWVVNRNDDTLLQYAPGNQGTGAQSPSAVITSGSLSSPQGADFDLAGDAWVGSAGSSTVSEFTPSQLGASGSPQAASTISSSALSNPTGIAIAQAPVVTSLTEKQTGAGTEVTITGHGFYPGATVQFGSTPPASVTYLSPFVLKALAPSGSGQVDVTVSTGEGTSAISPGDVYVFGGMSPTLIASNGSGVINLYPLGASGDYAPSAAISAGLSGPTREALDGAGDLWVVNAGAQTMLEYTRAQLQAGDLAAPAATLRLTTSGHPAALAFDASGNLWVALVRSSSPGASGGVVAEILRQQLADGSVSPAVTVATGPVESVAFDHEGDLWTVGAFFDGSVSEYASSELAAGAPRGPVTVLTDDGNGSLATAFALTFDAAGDLWVANAAGSIVKFTPDELQTGTPVPAVTITPQEQSLQGSGPAFAFSDLAFDAAGDLWALSNPSGATPSIIELSPDQLATSGSPSPHDTIAGIDSGLSFPFGLVLAQAPTVSALAPASGPSGTKVTISGTGFYPGATVEFGSAPATSVTDVSPYELTAVAPAGTGTVNVTVTTGEGPSTDSVADRFTYTAQSPATTATAATTTTTTTSSAAQPPTPRRALARPRITLENTHINVTRGAAQLPLACTLAPCQGTLKLTLQATITTHHGRHVIRRRTTLTLAAARYTLAAGRRRILDLTLSQRARSALAHAPGQRLAVRATATVSGGATLNKPVLLVPARRSRSSHQRFA